MNYFYDPKLALRSEGRRVRPSRAVCTAVFIVFLLGSKTTKFSFDFLNLSTNFLCSKTAIYNGFW
jgi:hypothetical protein